MNNNDERDYAEEAANRSLVQERDTDSTSGYRAIMQMVREDDVKYDPWGTALGWLGVIGDVVKGLEGRNMPEYLPGAFSVTRDCIVANNAYGQDVLDGLDNGTWTLADLESAYTILNRFADWVRLAGRDY